MLIRVLSYNIHKGFGLGNRNFTLHAIKSAIRSVSADIVFLQEVQGEHNQRKQVHELWPDEPQFEFLADEVWPHYAYGKNAVYTAGHHGNAILSKFPIVNFENVDISTNPLEQRGILLATLELPESAQRIRCMCLHLNLFNSGRRIQLYKLGELAKQESTALIICGDFNDWRERVTPILRLEHGMDELFLKLYGRHARTFPARLPLFRLDRIYFSGFSALSAKVLTGEPWGKLSDHAALLGELELSSSN